MRVLVIYGRLLRDLYRRFFPTTSSTTTTTTKVSRDNRLKLQRALRDLKGKEEATAAAAKPKVEVEGEESSPPSRPPGWQLQEQQMLQDLRKARKGLDQQAAALERQRERNRELMEFRDLAKGKARRENKMKQVLEEIEQLDKDYFATKKPENKKG
jgi:hypothetical protein